jgi:tetratricopeptide (TPR) repeat protein
MWLALILFLALPVQEEVTLSPDPAVAGKPLEIRVSAGGKAERVHLSNPFGSWRIEVEIVDGKGTVNLPADIPVLLVGFPQGERVDFPHSVHLVNGPDSRPTPEGYFWHGYLLGGLPAPFPAETTDLEAALASAREAARLRPDLLTTRELVWRIRAASTSDAATFLTGVDGELAADPSGRLALAAMRVHSQLGDSDGAQAIAEKYKTMVEPIASLEAGKWSEIISGGSAGARLEKIFRFITLDPFSDFMPQCFQILAPTYSALGDHRSTAVFGLLSLRITPDDAMTLNGVAFAMAEGEFDMERGLQLADRAVEILFQPGRLKKPPQFSQSQWQRELNHARAAGLDTKGWLLCKLGRWREAEDAFNMAIALESSDEYYLHLGITFMRQGKKEEARRAFNSGLRLGGNQRRRIETELTRLDK